MAGRPTNYSEEIADLAWDYIENYETVHEHAMPSIVGLCLVIDRARSTVHKWAKEEDKQFSDILEKIMEKQQLVIVNRGLRGEYNSTMSKLMLTKHGYSERQEIEVTDKTPPSAAERKERIGELLDKCDN